LRDYLGEKSGIILYMYVEEGEHPKKANLIKGKRWSISMFIFGMNEYADDADDATFLVSNFFI
jgi:hypothetical protein